MTTQSGDGYKCSCGFITDDKKTFTKHLFMQSRTDGKGSHKSMGRVNVITGEVTMPPYNERTPDQLKESNFGKQIQKITKDGKKVTVRQQPLVRTTDILAQASEIRFVPRIFTTTYTPIMQQGQDASVKYFGWRPNMPLENFIDTIIFLYFKEHGITLGAYMVDDSLTLVSKDKGDGDGDNKEEIPLKEG